MIVYAFLIPIFSFGIEYTDFKIQKDVLLFEVPACDARRNDDPTGN